MKETERVSFGVCVVAIVNDPSLLGSWARTMLSGVVLASR